QVCRLNRPKGGDQVGHLALCCASAAPLADVVIGGRLHAVFNFAYTCVVLAGDCRQLSTGQASVFAQVSKTDTKRLLRLFGGARRVGSHGEVSTASTPPRTLSGTDEYHAGRSTPLYPFPNRYQRSAGTLRDYYRTGRSHCLA